MSKLTSCISDSAPDYEASVDASPYHDGRSILEVQHVEKIYGNRDIYTHALNGLTFEMKTGDFIALMGPSGSGKTTLLKCIAALENLTAGSILVDGVKLNKLKPHERTAFRSKHISFIFQDSNLLSTLTGYENIALPLSIQGIPAPKIHTRVQEIASTLGIENELMKFPSQMSGGQCQRVAAARAIITKPKIVLADEPTGSLDSRNATILLELLAHINQHYQCTILMVTHSALAASYAQRALFIKDGKLFTAVERPSNNRKLFFEELLDVQAFLSGEHHAR